MHPLFAATREELARDGKKIDIRSVATVPFTIDRWRAGVLFLRTGVDERALTTEDVEFADIVIRAAVAAIRRAQALETTRADNRRLEALATTDPLTRVLNRRALLDRLTAEVDRARRFSSSLTLLLLDVDHFKQINDTAGHLAGDSVLRQLGALLEDAVRKVDVVARYGGEEFVAILPETASEGGSHLRRAAARAHRRAVVRRRRRSPGAFDGEHRRRHFSVSARRDDRGLFRAGGRGAVSREVRRPQPSAHLTNRCPTCGTMYADDARFCTRDGTRLLGATAGAGGAPSRQRAAQRLRRDRRPRRRAATRRHAGLDTPNLVGKTLQGHYEIVKKVGEGGMSFVYLANDIATRERYAIKVLSAVAVAGRERDGAAAPRGERSACGSRIRTSATSSGSARPRTGWCTS